MRLVRVFIATVFAAALIAARPDTFTREELDALEAERRAAEARLAALTRSGAAVRTDLEALEAALLAAAVDATRHEQEAAAAEARLAELAARRAESEARLAANEAALSELLAALAAANRRRPPALIVSPGNANTAVRRAIVMNAALPPLQARADALAAEITALKTAEAETRRAGEALQLAEAALAARKAEIEALAAEKRMAAEGVSGDLAKLRARAAALGEKADTLRALLAALDATAPEPPGAKPDLRPKVAALQPPARQSPAAAAPAVPATRGLGRAAAGSLRRPAEGKLVQRFGDTLRGGGTSAWMVYQTRAEAQVIAPAGGYVEYARGFRSYGEMLILRTSDGYHVILGGMSRIYVSEGQTVKAGEPVGRMPDRADPPPELTLELRLGERVLDPAKWMTDPDG